MNNMKKIMVFGVALLMVLTVFAAIPAPTKAAQFTLYGMINNTDGSTGDATTANSMSQTFGWRDAAPTEISIHGTPNDIFDAGGGLGAYEYADHGSQWPTGPAAGQEVCLSFEVQNGINGWTGGNQSTGQHQTITPTDIGNSETDMATNAQLNDLPDPYDDLAGNMAWAAMAVDTNGILSGYEIYESPDNSAGSYVAFAWVPAGTTTYSLASLTANNYYKIGFSYLYGYNTTVMSDVPFQNVAAAHTATATGPVTASSSNVAGITITYNYDAGTTGVDLYYTTDGGTTWNLIGNDATIDGSYAWTIPADGTYGWMAVADGETAPVGGEAPEAASYIYDGTAPTVSSTTPADTATNVPVNTDVVVVFGESMDNSVTPTLTQTAGTVVAYTPGVWSTTTNTDDTFTWTHADWALADSVSLNVDGAQDLAGNAQTAHAWSFTTAADSTPPVVTINSVVNPLEGGATQTIDATVDDSTTGGSNIVSATYTVIAPSGAVAIGNASMSATDGTFDSPTEAVTASYSTVGWATGTYTVFVYGSDGNIGSDSTTYVEQDTSAPALSYVMPSDGGTVAADQPINVLVDIADANQTSDIDNTTVILSWTNDSWTTTYQVTMTYDSNGVGNTVKYVSGRWSGTISAQADGTTISYYIDASDVATNAATGPTYTITASSTTLSDPYPVYGYAYLYNGNAGVYNPLLCDGTAYATANVDVSWLDSSTGLMNTVTVATDALGRYQVDLYNYTDGGAITVNASDSGLAARYNINTTAIVAANGGSMVNVTFGIPARLNFTDPTNPPIPQVSTGNAFNVQYTIYDDHGVIAPGYYGTVHITTNDTDPSVVLPADLAFDGVGGAVGDGQASPGQAILITIGLHYLNITDTLSDLTPPALYPNAGQWWDNITVNVTGLQFTWDLTLPGWHICSVPVVPVASLDSASEITALIDSVATSNGFALTDITIANRTGSSPSTYDTYIYGSGGVDFSIEVGMAYWVYVDQGFGSVGIQGNNYTTTTGTFTKNLYAGWNMIGIAHNYTGNGVVDFENNVNPGVAGAGAYITYSAGVPTNPYPGTAWYASYWNVGTQMYESYVYQFNQPTDARNQAINLINGATGFWLYVPAGGTMTYSIQN